MGPVAIAAIAAVLLVALSFRALSPSELRYAEAGREMWATGDWVVPRLGYVAYFEKPILFYWLEAASLALFGDNPAAARAPSILAAVAMVVITYALGRDLRGRTYGVVAAALLLAAPAFLLMGTAATTDPVFAACLVLSWYAFWRHDQRPASRWVWVFWGALGFAMMTKGPLGPALVGTTVVTYLGLSRRLKDLRLLHPIRGIALVLAINAPWSVLVWMRDPRFLQSFYIRQNLRAFVDAEINHGHSLALYPATLLVGFLPFAAAVLAGLWVSVRGFSLAAVNRLRDRCVGGPRASDAALYVSTMIWPPLILLSVAQSKLATYVLPLLPAVALVGAGFLIEALARPNWRMRWSAPALIGALAVGAALFIRHHDADVGSVLRDHRVVSIVAVAALMCAAVAGTVLVVRRRVAAGWTVAAGGAAVAILAALPVSDAWTECSDGRALVARLRILREPGSRIVLAGACSQDYSVVHGLQQRVAIWGRTRELGLGHFTEVTPASVPIPDDPYDVSADNLAANSWLLDDDRLAAMWRGTDRVWFIGRPEDVAKLRDAGLGVFGVAANPERVLVTNREPPTHL